MNIKPGDLFEWVYKYGAERIRKDENLYSTVMKKYVPCTGRCLCVGAKGEIIYWISASGLFISHYEEIVYRTNGTFDYGALAIAKLITEK
jgi:hypothetical protein